MSVKINLIDREGNKKLIESEDGISIKDAIMDKLSPGDFGLCGGMNICGTCHVYIDEKDISKLEPPSEDEIGTLAESNIDQTDFSRLSCQIELKEKLNDITVKMAIPKTL